MDQVKKQVITEGEESEWLRKGVEGRRLQKWDAEVNAADYKDMPNPTATPKKK